jgi:hypothetical protein
MEVFSKPLEEAGLRSEFEYYPKCETIKLTCLCFADDVLFFSKASVQYVEVINRVMGEFATISALKVDPPKSSIFFVLGLLWG